MTVKEVKFPDTVSLLILCAVGFVEEEIIVWFLSFLSRLHVWLLVVSAVPGDQSHSSAPHWSCFLLVSKEYNYVKLMWFSRNWINFTYSLRLGQLLTPANKNTKDNQCQCQGSGRLMSLLVVTALKHCVLQVSVVTGVPAAACVSRCQAPCWSRCPLPVGAWGVSAAWEEWQESGEVCSLHSCRPSTSPCSAASTHLTSSFSWWGTAQYFFFISHCRSGMSCTNVQKENCGSERLKIVSHFFVLWDKIHHYASRFWILKFLCPY